MGAAERHRLDAIATRVFSDLAKQFDAAGDGERAILAMERLIAIDPADEERLRRLLKLEARIEVLTRRLHGQRNSSPG